MNIICYKTSTYTLAILNKCKFYYFCTKYYKLISANFFEARLAHYHWQKKQQNIIKIVDFKKDCKMRKSLCGQSIR